VKNLKIGIKITTLYKVLPIPLLVTSQEKKLNNLSDVKNVMLKFFVMSH